MQNDSFDEQMMDAAMALAMRGRGRVEPNPMVGCVIAREERIIGQGWHERFGAPHAEPNALAACTESPRGASAYVTLEPCCHTNKKTPPCMPRLIEAGIARVVIGCVDPNPAVAGRGMEQLRTAGIDVRVGIRQERARQLIAPFFCRTQLHRPYVTLKWAQDPSGQIGASGVQRQWISNPTSSRLVHHLRARSDGILVGINTVRADDPILTVRGVEPMRPLLRAVLDKNLSIAIDSRLVQSAREQPLIVYCAAESLAARHEHAAQLTAMGAQTVPVPVFGSGLDLRSVLTDLHRRDVTHLLVEPGPTLARSFIESNLADRAWIIYGAKRLPRSATSLDAAPMPFTLVASGVVAEDRVEELLNTKGDAFFAMNASADAALITGL